MEPVTAHVGTTHFRIRVSPAGVLENGVVIRDIVQNFISWKFDPRTRQWSRDRDYLYYDKPNMIMHLHRNCLYLIEQRVKEFGGELRYEPLPTYEPKRIDIELNPEFPPKEHQIEAIKYLSYDSAPIRGAGMQTGKGKTFAMIATMVNLGYRAIIEESGLTDQWKRALLKFTDLKEKDIYEVHGSLRLALLLHRIDRTLKPKVILASTPTLKSYMDGGPMYENYPPFDMFYDKLKVGVRFVDEAHLRFHTNHLIELRSNVPNTIVATATFDRTDKTGKWVFDHAYPEEIRYGSDQYHKYVKIYEYSYRFALASPRKFKSMNGYSHSKYESFILKDKRRLVALFQQLYRPLIDGHYINIKNPGERLLILCSTEKFCESLKELVIGAYPDLKVGVKVFKSPESVLEESDIIISTPFSAGTGRDISLLRTVILTVSIASAPLNEQILGRLRELLSGAVPEFVYVADLNVDSHVSHQDTRRPLFEEKALQFIRLAI